MRARFERLSRVSRGKMQRKFPKLVFADHAVGEVGIESVCAVESPARVILYLHGGGGVSWIRLLRTGTGRCA